MKILPREKNSNYDYIPKDFPKYGTDFSRVNSHGNSITLGMQMKHRNPSGTTTDLFCKACLVAKVVVCLLPASLDGV